MKRNPNRKTPYTRCTVCAKLVRLKASGGDWLNDLYPVRHNDMRRKPCAGRFIEVENNAIYQDK